jgi:hypothetical protein
MSLLTIARAEGYNVFVIPGSGGVVQGLAWCAADGAFINVHVSLAEPVGLFVLAHEMAHHRQGHTRYWSSRPMWMEEYFADRAALDMLRWMMENPTND